MPGLRALLQELGATVVEQPVGPGRTNLLALWGRPRVLFSTHLDTVPPFLPPHWEGEQLCGRGACDAKGQIVAQLMAIAPDIKLITFDGDLTLYQDGRDLDPASPLVHLITRLLVDHGIHVSIVTAAGYSGPDAPARYHQRHVPLLRQIETAFRNLAPAKRTARTFVMGGESSYLFAFGPVDGDPSLPWTLRPVPPEAYLSPEVAAWSSNPALVSSLLDAAQRGLETTAKLLGLQSRTRIVRKERAVGVVPLGVHLEREQLDEFALAGKEAVASWQASRDLVVPFCSFNGGSDCFVDVGNKLVGVRLLLGWLGLEPGEALHVGDQFLGTGNDVAARGACATVWVAGPGETAVCLEELLEFLKCQGTDEEGMSPRLARLPLEDLPAAQAL